MESLFCEEVKTTEEYLKIKSEIDDIIWSAEYMQEPIEKIGMVFYEPDLNNFSMVDVKEADFESSLGYTDVADQGDDALCQGIGRNIGPKVFITDFVYDTNNTDVTRPVCADRLNKNKCKLLPNRI